MSWFPPYLRVATISLLNFLTLLFRWTRGMESRFPARFQRGLLGRPLRGSMPMKAHPTRSFFCCIDVIFFRPMGHYVRINYSVLLNMAPVYILLLYVWFEHPGHTYGGFVSALSEQGTTPLSLSSYMSCSCFALSLDPCIVTITLSLSFVVIALCAICLTQ
jgi:hypothetical protein